MRPTSVLLSFCALFVSASASTILVRQADTPPSCSLPCLNTGTDGVPLGSCGATDIVCQCSNPAYVQGVINCFAIQCSNHDDVLTAIQFSAAYCAVEGVNAGPTGITTPLSQLPNPTSSGGGSSNGTSQAPAGTTSPAASASATTSHSGALGSIEPRIALSALLFAAIGVAASL